MHVKRPYIHGDHEDECLLFSAMLKAFTISYSRKDIRVSKKTLQNNRQHINDACLHCNTGGETHMDAAHSPFLFQLKIEFDP